MGTTLNRAYRYPGQGDEPDVPLRIQQLAEDIDADVKGINDKVTPLIAPAWTTAALSGAWVAYDGAGGYPTGGILARNVGSMLHISGMVKSGAVGPMGTLPANVRPANSVVLPAMTNSGAIASIAIARDTGVISYLSGPAAPGYVAINAQVPR